MKSLFIAATLAVLTVPYAAPLAAASLAPAVQTLGSDEALGRHGCDTPRDIRQHPRCSR